MDSPFHILPTDQRFFNAGDECSRCGKAIPETVVPVMAWPESGAYEYRFHPECLGFDTFDELEGDAVPRPALGHSN